MVIERIIERNSNIGSKVYTLRSSKIPRVKQKLIKITLGISSIWPLARNIRLRDLGERSSQKRRINRSALDQRLTSYTRVSGLAASKFLKGEDHLPFTQRSQSPKPFASMLYRSRGLNLCPWEIYKDTGEFSAVHPAETTPSALCSFRVACASYTPVTGSSLPFPRGSASKSTSTIWRIVTILTR